jgi:integrase
MQKKITKTVVDAMQPRDFRTDTEVIGFVVRCLPSGKKCFGYAYRDAGGRQRWLSLGVYGAITVDQARKQAKQRAGEVAAGRDPRAERIATRAREVLTVNVVLDEWLDRDARKRLRTAGAIAKVFDKHVRPAIGKSSIYGLERRDIIKMLDAIEDGSGPVMADRTLAYVRKAFNWHAVRDEKFRSPIIKGMARTKAIERARQRVLTDPELRAVWRAAEADDGPFGAYVRFLLLTACRRNEAAGMHCHELSNNDWVIPPERYKTGKELVIPLSESARAVLAMRPNGFVFGSGDRPLSGFSKFKLAFVRRALAVLREADPKATLPRWTLHDLRRTARSLMSRAKVPPDDAERCLGHAIGGVRGIYDRFEYYDQKREAFERLGQLIATIVNPPSGDNVVTLREADGRRLNL